MIDLHCHLLPGVDDGALDVGDSVGMALQARADGIDTICSTPHIRHDHDVRIAELGERVAVLQRELDRRGAGVRVLPGGEVAETIVDRLSRAELATVTLGGAGRWVLLEPRPGPLSDSLDAAVETLAVRGCRALVAHPERHLGPDSFDRLAALVRRGALVQATAAFFEPGPAAEGMLELARRGLVHVLGSDAHSSHGGRPVRLSPAVDALRSADRIAPHLEWVVGMAPAAIVAGEDVDAPYAAG